jgi:hypothetical protein
MSLVFQNIDPRPPLCPPPPPPNKGALTVIISLRVNQLYCIEGNRYREQIERDSENILKGQNSNVLAAIFF